MNVVLYWLAYLLRKSPTAAFLASSLVEYVGLWVLNAFCFRLFSNSFRSVSLADFGRETWGVRDVEVGLRELDVELRFLVVELRELEGELRELEDELPHLLRLEPHVLLEDELERELDDRPQLDRELDDRPQLDRELLEELPN
ncbi:MAG: hypothetical protein ACFCD0_11145, partial [Gemmataceae bacterium]